MRIHFWIGILLAAITLLVTAVLYPRLPSTIPIHWNVHGLADNYGPKWLLQILPGEPLTPWTHNGELDDAVFQVAATFPLKKMEVGVVHEGPPFDVEEFFKQVGARAKPP